MPERPPVSVVVCTRDRPALLGEAVRSIAAALTGTDELVVVEAGDSGAGPLVEALGVDARVLAAERPGKSRQLNLGIAAARSPLLLLTDDDVVVPPRWADELAAPFADERVGVAFGPVRGLSHVGGEAARLPSGDAPLQTWAYAHGASMALRAACIADIGGFDERLGPGAPAHGEEHDVVLRAWERGWRVVIADAEPVGHLEWRSADEHLANLLVYQRGAGAFLGAALRRRPSRWWKYAVLRARFEAAQFRASAPDGRPLGWRGVRAFAGGVVHGLRLPPRRYLERTW